MTASDRVWRADEQSRGVDTAAATGVLGTDVAVEALGLLNPLIAGAAMSLSSLLAVTNSPRLRGFRASGRGAEQPQE